MTIDPRIAHLEGDLERRAGGKDAAALARRLHFTPASAITPEATRWSWAGRIPLGAVTLLAGKQGLGKSTLTLELAAQLSRGELDGDLHGKPAAALIVSYEDHPASTISPRLIAAGADLERVHVVSAERDGAADLVSLPDDLETIGAAARDRGARLLVVDPLVAALPSGDINAHRDQDVRRVLAPLARLAEEADLSVVGLIHFNKSPGVDALARVSGSTGFTAAARSVLAFGADPEDGEGEGGGGRVLAHAKSNLGPHAPSLRCHLEGREVEGAGGAWIGTSRLVIGAECDTRAGDLLAPSADRSEIAEAADFLEAALEDGDWHPSSEIKRAGKAAGHAARTLQRAVGKLGLEIGKGGFPRRTRWRLAVAPTASGATDEPEAGATVQTRTAERKTEESTLQSRQATDSGATERNGWSPEAAEAFIARAHVVFPGSYEIAANGRHP